MVNEIEVRCNSNLDEVDDNDVIQRSDMIIHNTYVCKSAFFRITRYIKSYRDSLSAAEIANDILLDNIR